MYVAPESKVLMVLANVAATSQGSEPVVTAAPTEDDPFGGQTFIGDCL